jgi:hypothetical protein
VWYRCNTSLYGRLLVKKAGESLTRATRSQKDALRHAWADRERPPIKNKSLFSPSEEEEEEEEEEEVE